MSAAPRRRAGRALVPLVLAISVAGLGLRLWGIRFLQPLHPEPDGNVIVTQVARMEGATGLPEPDLYWRYYPHLVARLATLLPEFAPEVQPGQPRELERHLARAAAPYMRVRYLVALLAALAVPATYALARRFLDPAWSVVAACLMATSVLHLWFAQQARPHAPAATFVLLAVLASLRLRARGSAGAFLLAGAATGLALGVLQSGAVALLPLTAAGLLRERGPRAVSRLWLLPALALAGLIGWAFYPAGAEAPDGGGGTGRFVEYLSEANVLVLSGHHIPLDDFNGAGAARLLHALVDYEPILAVLLAVALALGFARLVRPPPPRDRGRTADLLVVLVLVVPYLVAFGLYARTYQRFAVPLLPYAFVFAAWGLARVAALLRGRRGARAGRVAALLLAGLPVAAQSVLAARLALVRAAPTTFDRAAAWLVENADPAARITLVPPVDLPLTRTAEALQASDEQSVLLGYPWAAYQLQVGVERVPGPRWDLRSVRMKPFVALPDTQEGLRTMVARIEEHIQGLDSDYAVIGLYPPWRFLSPAVMAYRAALARHGALVARFSPDGAPPEWTRPIDYQDDLSPGTPPWAWRVLLACCTGPTVEIYALR